MLEISVKTAVPSGRHQVEHVLCTLFEVFLKNQSEDQNQY